MTTPISPYTSYNPYSPTPQYPAASYQNALPAYDPYAGYNPYAAPQQPQNPYASAPQQQAYPASYPMQNTYQQPSPPMPPAPDMNLMMDKYVPTPDTSLPSVSPVSNPATSELPPNAKSSQGGEQKKKSKFPKLVGWLVAAGALYLGYRKFMGKKGDAAQDEALSPSPLAEAAKTFLSGVNKDELSDKTLKQFEEHLFKANKSLNEDEKVDSADIKAETTKLLQNLAEGDDEKTKEIAQAILDKKDAPTSETKPAETATVAAVLTPPTEEKKAEEKKSA